MRLIALLSIYNRGDFKRIELYLKEQSAFPEDDPVTIAERISELGILRKRLGRLRFQQIAGLSELNVIAILATEKEPASLMMKLSVASDYPHLLTHWQMGPIHSETGNSSSSADWKLEAP